METSSINTPTKTPPRRENIWANLLLNIIIPTLILTKASGDDALGPKLAVVVALLFPVAYGVYDFIQAKKVNIFSAIGFFSVLISGSMLIFKAPPEYMAIKEAAVPGLIGIVVAVLSFTRYSPIKLILYNESIVQVNKLKEQLKARAVEDLFDKALRLGSLMFAASFFISSVLNYVLAKMVLKSPPGTEAFNAEYGKMMALSFPVITIPSTIVLLAAIFYLFWRIDKLTGMGFEDLFVTPEPKPKKTKKINH